MFLKALKRLQSVYEFGSSQFISEASYCPFGYFTVSRFLDFYSRTKGMFYLGHMTILKRSFYTFHLPHAWRPFMSFGSRDESSNASLGIQSSEP